MKCPVCKEPDLIMSERKGVEIDYCANCRGVWLDRGELDKIIEKSMETIPIRPISPEDSRSRSNPCYDSHEYHHEHHKHGGHHGYKRKSWLGDFFD